MTNIFNHFLIFHKNKLLGRTYGHIKCRQLCRRLTTSGNAPSWTTLVSSNLFSFQLETRCYYYLLLTVKCNYQQRDVLYHVMYVRMDAEEEVQNRNTENTRVTWFSLDGLHPRRNSLRSTSLLYKSVYKTRVTMSHNMSIYATKFQTTSINRTELRPITLN